jgi:dihydrofolate reductase
MTTMALIAAMAQNRVIGRNNQLPWRLSADLKHFKALTMGKPIVMGRRTHESIGRPLPGRQNIVVTRDPDYSAQGCTVVHSISQALDAAGPEAEVMIMGGAELYRQTIGQADQLYLTLVQADIEGDVWFPEIDPGQWHEIERQRHLADEHNEYDYDFIVMQRVRRQQP